MLMYNTNWYYHSYETVNVHDPSFKHVSKVVTSKVEMTEQLTYKTFNIKFNKKHHEIYIFITYTMTVIQKSLILINSS